VERRFGIVKTAKQVIGDRRVPNVADFGIQTHCPLAKAGWKLQTAIQRRAGKAALFEPPEKGQPSCRLLFGPRR